MSNMQDFQFGPYLPPVADLMSRFMLPAWIQTPPRSQLRGSESPPRRIRPSQMPGGTPTRPPSYVSRARRDLFPASISDDLESSPPGVINRSWSGSDGSVGSSPGVINRPWSGSDGSVGSSPGVINRAWSDGSVSSPDGTVSNSDARTWSGAERDNSYLTSGSFDSRADALSEENEHIAYYLRGVDLDYEGRDSVFYWEDEPLNEEDIRRNLYFAQRMGHAGSVPQRNDRMSYLEDAVMSVGRSPRRFDRSIYDDYTDELQGPIRSSYTVEPSVARMSNRNATFAGVPEIDSVVPRSGTYDAAEAPVFPDVPRPGTYRAEESVFPDVPRPGTYRAEEPVFPDVPRPGTYRAEEEPAFPDAPRLGTYRAAETPGSLTPSPRRTFTPGSYPSPPQPSLNRAIGPSRIPQFIKSGQTGYVHRITPRPAFPRSLIPRRQPVALPQPVVNRAPIQRPASRRAVVRPAKKPMAWRY